MSSPSIIPDDQITASSKFEEWYHPFYGRLHGNRGDGWCAREESAEDWLQIDFGKTLQVCAVATQGDINGDEWVTDFKLSFSSDGRAWTTYQDTNGTELVKIIRYLINIKIKMLHWLKTAKY